MISDSDIQKVREATDIVALFAERQQMRQRGRDFWCCCPFHSERTPSCKVDPNTQLWHCFGCGEGGDVFSYVMKAEDMTFVEAVHFLADKAHVDIEETEGKGISRGHKQRLRDVCKAAADFFHNQLMRGVSSGAARARQYLAGRNFGGDVPKNWNLGYAPGSTSLVDYLTSLNFKAEEMLDANVASCDSSGRMRDRFFDRVMFPINDASGECIAFGGRIIGDGNPKYLNSQETAIFHKSQVLYGLDKAKTQMASSGSAIVVEGYTDVIALHEAGIRNAVATLGTALTMQHIRLLSRHAGRRIVYLFDGDEAGQRAAERALQFIDYAMTPEAGKTKMEICAVTLPNGLDPAEFVAAHGKSGLDDLLQNAKPLIVYGIERRIAKHDIGTAEGRSAALVDALQILIPIKESVLAKDYAAQIAGMVHVREADALEKLASLKQPSRKSYAAESEKPNTVRTTTLPEAEMNRLRFEREFLGLAAQNPLLALGFADTMSKTRWHDKQHCCIADAIVAALMENPGISAADLVAKASLVSKYAPAILTAAEVSDGSSAADKLAYLANEISIGDGEEAMAALKAKLIAGNVEDADAAFNELVAMQRRLTELRQTRNLS
ncbi:DNA primase [Adlercreutzia sp. ZJ154]|uniref:DNA primase n=1 Tax=Adlercreutzia sp. ZJ154 TaxID=2709790 RepID=UPI001F15528C|nr:DNA primase [Adlercreutzia sp. ZJ154]